MNMTNITSNKRNISFSYLSYFSRAIYSHTPLLIKGISNLDLVLQGTKVTNIKHLPDNNLSLKSISFLNSPD